MKKTRRLTVLIVVITMLCGIFALASCAGGGKDTEDSTLSQILTNNLEKLTAPTVTLTGDIATWDADESADKFEISVDGNLSYIENTVTSRKLTDGQTFKIRAIGDGISYGNSNWSNSVTYVKPSDAPVSEASYTITWKNGDVVLETDADVAEGTLPTYDGTVPTKAADAQYTYAFSGWTPEVVAANGDATYSAVFSAVKNKYTVTWKNGDTVLETDVSVEYGEMPKYDGAEPQKAADAQYIYVFSGWSPVVSEVLGSVTYEAQFTSAPNTYTVIWKNGDSVLETDEEVPYGATPSYDDATPIKASTDRYVYTFSGWSPEISAVTESITYTAQFTATVRRYTVTFYSEDGSTVLDAVTVEYGKNAAYTKEPPVKNATEGYTYIFEKWVTEQGGSVADDLTNVTANRSVYASFKAFGRTVTVYVVSNNTDYGTVSHPTLNNVPYGSEIVINGNTVIINGQTVSATAKDATERYTYTFDGWTADATVGNDTIITATFSRSVNTYTVIWKNGDTILETDENVTYGTTPVYNGETPTKPSDDEYTYTFSGWSPSVSSVTGDVTYCAQFTDATNKYTVTFYDDDGFTVLGVSVVAYGDTATYPNALPTKASTAQYSYTFDKWVTQNGGTVEASFENITGNQSVYAKYTEATRSYTVTFCDWDGTVLYEQTVPYGSAASFPEEEFERDGYRFDGWDKTFNNVVQDLTVTARYVAVVEVQFVDYDGSVIYSEFVDKGADFVNIPSDPTRQDYKFTGWSTNTFTDIVEDLTVYAQYVRTYRVAFVDYNGDILKSDNIVSGTAAQAPADPSREGYVFVGWDKAFDNVTSHLTVTARYTINQYTVTFVMPDGTVIAQKTVKHGYRVIAPDVSDKYFHLGASNDQYVFVRGYCFTEWDRSLENITEAQTITAVYGTLITEPFIAAERKAVVTSQGTEVMIKLYIINGNAPCGISLDLQIDPTLLKGGTPIITVSGQQSATGSEYYESKLNNEGLYEFRWTKNNGIQNDTIVTFTFNLNVSESEGEYPIDILDSTYIITNELEKVTPALIDGSVIVQK